MLPSYMRGFIPPLVSEISDSPLRNNKNILVPLNRTCISLIPCTPSSIMLWNSLEDDLKHFKPLKAYYLNVQ